MSKKGKGKNGKGKARHMKSEGKTEKQIKSKRKARHMRKHEALRRALRALDKKDQDFRDALLEEGFTLKPWKGKNPLMINESYIVCPKRFKRHGKDDFSDLKNVAELDPIEVIKLPGEKLVIIVNGGRRFLYQYQENERKKRKQVFKCTVLGIAESRSSITKKFAKSRLDFHKLTTSLEMVQAVLEHSEQLHKDYPGQIRGHGGPPGKISEVQEIQKDFGLTNRAARYLLNFGKHLGMDALLGLAPHGLNPPSDQIENLVKQGIAEETGKKIAQSLKRKEKSLGRKLKPRERAEIAGKHAYPIIKTQFQGADNQGDEPEDDPDETGDDGAPDGEAKFDAHQPHVSIGPDDITKYKALQETAQAKWEALGGFSADKTEFTKRDTIAWHKQREAFEQAYAHVLIHMAVVGIRKNRRKEKKS